MNKRMVVNPQYIVLFHHFRELLKAVLEQNIDIAPLKGAHLLTSVHPNGFDRGKLSDVDFLVRPEDWNTAIALMERVGFKRRENYVDETATFEVGFLFDITSQQQILFELHRYLFEPCRFPIDHEPLWQRAIRSTFDGIPCMRLSAEDHFCHIAFHCVIHRLIGLERTKNDLLALLKSDDLKITDVIERAREWRMTRAIWFFLKILADSQADEDLKTFASEIEPPKPIAAVLTALSNDVVLKQLAKTHHRIQAALLWPFLFDSLSQEARCVLGHPFIQKVMGRYG